MEYQKITNLLDTTWVEVYDQSGNAEDRYKPSKQIRFKTSMLRSDLCDYSDAYIVVKGDITLTKTNGRGIIDIRNRFLAFKNNAPFTNCISKINNVLIDNAEDLDVDMPMYSLLQYNKNYRKTTGRLWNYYRGGPNNLPPNSPVGNNTPTVNYNTDPITNSESFKYKISITGKTSNANQENSENTEQENTKTKKILKLLFR